MHVPRLCSVWFVTVKIVNVATGKMHSFVQAHNTYIIIRGSDAAVFAAFLALLARQQKPSWLLFFGVLFTFGGSIIMAKVWDGHGARRAGADDPPGCHQGSVADPDREDEG